MIRRRRKRREPDRALEAAKLRTSVSHSRAKGELRASQSRLEESRRVAIRLALCNDSVLQWGLLPNMNDPQV